MLQYRGGNGRREGGLNTQEQAAIEAVVEHFSGTWEEGEDPPDAYLVVARQRIAVQVTTVQPRTPEQGRLAKPRLRFDKVALRVLRALQVGLSGSVPDGETVVLTITAPIRLPSKTAAALEDKIRAYLARPSALEDGWETIHENRIRVRLVKSASAGASKVIGFVHNPDSDPDLLLDMTQLLLERIGAAAGKPAPAGSASARWLVLATADGPAQIETYRQVYAQLSISTEFKKILIVLAGGRVEILSDGESTNCSPPILN